MKPSVFDEPLDPFPRALPKNLQQTRRGIPRPRTPSLDIAVPQPKRSKTKPPGPRTRPLGMPAGSDRLRLSTDVVVGTQIPNAGQLLKNVRPSNPKSILDANEALTSSSVPKSNIVDPVAAGMQTEIVRNQLLHGPDDGTRLKSACVQIANAKSLMELARKSQLLDLATKKVKTLSDLLGSERTASEEKLKQIKRDNDALQKNNEDAAQRFEEAQKQALAVKKRYDEQCSRWRDIKFQNDQLATRLSTSKKEEARVRRENQAQVQLLQNQLKTVNLASEKFGREREAFEDKVDSLEGRVKLAEGDLERAIAKFGRDKGEIEDRMKRLQDENYELAEANEGMITEQLSLREQLEQANGYCRQAREQIQLIGGDAEDKDHTIMELRSKVRNMEMELEKAHGVAIYKDMELLAKGQEAKVITGQFERQLNMNGQLMWQNQNLERSLLSSEDEVIKARSQCPYTPQEDVEMGLVAVSGGTGGTRGGGFGFEPGGAAMRPQPGWMERDDTEQALDFGDDPYKPAPEFTVTGETDSGALFFGLLLLLIVAVYMGYR